MKVLVTGARQWPDRWAVFQALTVLYRNKGPFKLVHGACPTGADAFAHDWFVMVGSCLGCTEQRWPAVWIRQDGTVDKSAGFARNARMVADGADLVLAFPLPEGKGTQHTMKLAKEAGIKVITHKRKEAPPVRVPRQRRQGL